MPLLEALKPRRSVCRDQARLLKMDSNGTLLKISKAWPSFQWKSVMDMEMAPDGSLYTIEFGDGFNLIGAQLSRMRYLGAPNPITCQVSATSTAGQAPLTVQFSTDGTSSR